MMKITNEMLCNLIKQGDMDAKQCLCIKNWYTVKKIAERYVGFYGNDLELDDLFQTGMMGLLKAAEKYDQNRGVIFMNYAQWWIRQGIIREIEDHGFAIRKPNKVIDQIMKIEKLARTKYSDCTLTADERCKLIANEMGLTAEQVKKYVHLREIYLRNAVLSLDVPINEYDEVTLIDVLTGKSVPSVEDKVIHTIMRETIDEVLYTLTQRQRVICKLHYGLFDDYEYSFSEIGKMYCVDQNKIKSVHNKAMRRLNYPSKISMLEDFWKNEIHYKADKNEKKKGKKEVAPDDVES